MTDQPIPPADYPSQENRPPSPFLVTLFCYVVGSKTPFSVAISSSLTVDHLKKMIQQERPNLLKGIDPADLELFNVSLPSGRDLVEQVKDAVEVAEPLDPTTDIIEIFPDDSPKKIIHIAVRLPHDADFQFSKMHPSPYVYKHPLLQTVKPGSVPQDLQHLYELAWKNRNRESLFQLVSANNDSSPGGFQYESLISTEDFDELPMAKYGILITPEYKAALSDAKRWFSGGKVSPTASDTKNVLKPNERQDDEGESGTGEDGTGEDGTGEDGTGEDGTGEDKGKDKDDVETGLPEEDWPADRTFDRRFFIVVGTPGIGKSLCLYYILVERLLARLPTCFQTVPGFFTFWCEEGVFQIPLDKHVVEIRKAIPANAWFLVDSNRAYPTPDGMLKQVNACVVQAASPRADHLRWTEKANLKHFRWYIKPSPLEESLMIKRLHDTNTTDEQWTEFFEKYGPSTRLLVSYAETPDLFDAALNDKLVPVSSAGLRDLLFPSSGNNVTQEEVSHWICGINPGPCRNQPYGTFHTPTILRMVKERYKEQWIKEVEWAYTIFKSNPYTRVPAGHILEDRVHDVLVNGGCWKMVKLSGNSKGSTNNIYRIPEAPLNRWLVVSSAGVRVEETRPLNPTGPLELHWFRDIKSIDRYKMGYYRPRKPNQPTLDAYIVNPLDKSVFMIQITIAKDHDAKQEGSEDLRVNYLGYTFYYIVVADELDIAIKMPKEADRMWESRWCLLADEDMLFPKQNSSAPFNTHPAPNETITQTGDVTPNQSVDSVISRSDRSNATPDDVHVTVAEQGPSRKVTEPPRKSTRIGKSAQMDKAESNQAGREAKRMKTTSVPSKQSSTKAKPGKRN